MISSSSHATAPVSYLFVYVQNDRGNFWTFDGAQYHRFVWRKGVIRFVRSQPHLPPVSSGVCLQITMVERRILLNEARAHNILIPFYNQPNLCQEHALAMPQQQYVFDAQPPAAALQIYPADGSQGLWHTGSSEADDREG